MTIDRDTLRQMIEEDELGLLALPAKRAPVTADQRLVDAFRQITEFVEANGREPVVNPEDLEESKLAWRLEAICSAPEQRAVLEAHDRLGLLRDVEAPASIEEAVASDPLGLLSSTANDVYRLEHVPKRQTMPDEIARRRPAKDFDDFKRLFEVCHEDLREGRRELIEFRNPTQLSVQSFFVLNGVLGYVAEMGARSQNEIGKSNARLRCIFENGTESNLLLQSLASNMYKSGKRVTEPRDLPTMLNLAEGTRKGVVYVLRSLSKDPQVQAIPDLHKIGSTSNSTEGRVASATRISTFLGAPVEILAEWEVPAVAARRIEGLLHRLFSTVRADVWFERDGEVASEVREWFSVPLPVIDQAVDLISSEAIVNYEYDPDARELRLLTDVTADS